MRGFPETYRCHIREELCKIANHSVDILVLINEAMAFGVCDLSNDIECEVLQPFGKVADFAWRCVKPVGLGQEQVDNLIHEWLVLHEGAHRKGIVDRTPKIGMIRLICGREQGRQTLAVADCHLHWIEARLDGQSWDLTLGD